ncbi:hypothetical protein PISL3812_04269 [Talaromyces islandicus]|uniref:Uncharacterized protein n=1 Tax=Talaromyces islandicus TaxID=28573 RepID=A0A0U1LVY1_TALIS|nr:hypothetical protein PISL3812_04269 [Talaromyces islandicus]
MADTELHDIGREDIIKIIKKLLEHHSPTVSPLTRDFLWLSDLENLKGLRTILAEDTGDTARRNFVINALTNDTEFFMAVMSPWMTKARRDSDQPDTVPSTPKQESKKWKICEVLASSPMTTSKYPALQSSPSLPTFSSPNAGTSQSKDWPKTRDQKLRGFLETAIKAATLHVSRIVQFLLEHISIQKEVKAWSNALSGPRGSERIENIITMDCSVHTAWNLNLFALKYIETSLDQRFPTELISEKPDLPEKYTPPALYGPQYYNIRTDTAIKSGDFIYMTTTDPANLPLPNKHLITMQWHLHRIAAISGAADIDACYRNDDDDDYGEDGFCVGVQSSQVTGSDDSFSSSFHSTVTECTHLDQDDDDDDDGDDDN